MMLTLKMIKDWIKTLGPIAEYFYVGKLDNKQEHSVGIYASKKSLDPYIALGGQANASYRRKAITILIHWDKNQDTTERASMLLYSKLEANTDIVINGIRIMYLELLDNEPINVGTDDKGVYEMVINAVFYYEKKEA